MRPRRARSGRRWPPARQVQRGKLVTALSLLGVVALTLVLFGTVLSGAARRIVHDRVGDRLERQVDAGTERVVVDRRGDLQVGELQADLHLTSGYPQLYVVSDGVAVIEPLAPLWPEVDVLTPAARAIAGGAEPVRVTTTARPVVPDAASEDVWIRAAPVTDADGRAVAVVVGVASIGSGEAAYQQLTGYLWWFTAGLLVMGLVVAVVLARGRFWLVDRAIADHERFLHDTAHELRNPVATLLAITDAGLSGQEPPERALVRASEVLHQTDEVIDDLVTLARIEVGRDEMEARPLRLDLLVEALVAQRDDDPPIEVATSPTVVGAQPNLVRRAVGNIVDNAVRHGRAADPAATVTVTVADGRVTVLDRGPGMSQALVTRVVHREGARRGQRSAPVRGSGLGLATAQWVATVHGGRLEVGNHPDGGAWVTLHLPPADVVQDRGAAAATAPGRLGRSLRPGRSG